MMAPMNLRGKTVLITGAARRIGREIALTLAKRGAAVVIHFRRSGREAADLEREITEMGESAHLVKADFSVSKTASLLQRIKRFTDEVYRTVERVDVLVNNASVFYPAPFGEITEAQWDDFLTANLKAPFFLSQEIGKRMLKQESGKIINLIDWTVCRPRRDYLPYAVSKAGLHTATVGLAREMAPFVQVLGIAPGPILPPKGATGEDEKRIARNTLLKRFGHPRDIAETVRFLIEGTDFMTGAVIPVDGGASVV